MIMYYAIAFPISAILAAIIYKHGIDFGLYNKSSKIGMAFVNFLICLMLVSIVLLIIDERNTDKVRIVKGYRIYSTESSFNSNNFILATRQNTKSGNETSREYCFYKRKNGGYFMLTTDVDNTIIKLSKTNQAHLDIAYCVMVSRFGIFPPRNNMVAYYIIYLPKEYVVK